MTGGTYTRTRRAAVIAALALATLVRLAALPLRGTEDMGAWKLWMIAASKDATAVYGVGGDPPVRGVIEWKHLSTTVDYPPLALYELGAMGVLYRAVDPRFENDRFFTAAIKIPGLLFGMALTCLLWWTARTVTGDEENGTWVAVAYWANPAVILNGEVLGYLDPLMMLPALASLVLAHFRVPAWAGACLAMAILTKPQGILIAPVCALAVWRSDGMRGFLSAAAGGALTTGVIVLPYALVGALPNMWLAFGSFYARRDILSGYAANIWWIANYVLRAWYQIPRLGVIGAFLAPVRRIMAISTFQEVGLPNPRPFGTTLVLLTTAWGLWRLRTARDLALFALGAAFVVHAFFVLSVGVHEHHMMLAVPMLALAAALRRSLRPLFWTVSAIVALNMNLFYGIGLGLGWSLPRSWLLVDLTVWLSAANVCALAWHARTLTREVAATAADIRDNRTSTARLA
jgi:hypothetical protein